MTIQESHRVSNRKKAPSPINTEHGSVRTRTRHEVPINKPWQIKNFMELRIEKAPSRAQFGPNKEQDRHEVPINKPWQFKNLIEFRIEKGLNLETRIDRSLSKPEQEVLINKIV